LAKVLASAVIAILGSSAEPDLQYDSSTNALIRRQRALKNKEDADADR
jgi:hypothetical protein